MAVSRQNCNVASMIVFLHRLANVSTINYYLCGLSSCFYLLIAYLIIQVFVYYFEELEEESLRDNFVVVVRTKPLPYID